MEAIGAIDQARLLVTADSRYQLHVNDRWLGAGPPRSWPSPWPVDAYDLRGLLRTGRNRIAVCVQHYGIGNFQYQHGPPGLLGQLDWQDAAGEHRVRTDASWKAAPDPRHQWPVPRISCQLGWEEQFDARLELPHHSDWIAAQVARPAGSPPHDRFELRDIPMLTNEVLEPVCVPVVEAVQSADQTLLVDVRPFINDTDRSANRVGARVLVVTHIHSDQAQRVQFHNPAAVMGVRWKLNGSDLRFDDGSLQHTDGGVAHANLKRGCNMLLGRFPDVTHCPWTALNMWTDRQALVTAQLELPTGDDPVKWLVLGPFDRGGAPDSGSYGPAVTPDRIYTEATEDRYQSIWERGTLTDADLMAPWARPVWSEAVVKTSVAALCASERVARGRHVQVENPDGLRFDNAEWTVIHPTKDGDVRLLLDFGREVVGPHDFEIDAPAGTIVDNHNFEFIQPDGRINLCDGMNNSFRYICREGAQRYRTWERRGLRYSWFTLRHFDRPVRIRSIRALMSTYPVAQAGAFTCSDPMLTSIWRAGAHSVRCCAEDTYTDCPTYEQTHWVGDARNEALVDLVVNGDARLSRHCWIQAARSLDRSSIVESHVPSAWQNLLPAWSFLWMRWAEEHYQLTGDKAFAREALRWLDRNVSGIKKHLDGNDLFVIEAWCMFDWADMDTPSGGIVTHQNCLAVLGLKQAAALATAVGSTGRARRWLQLSQKISRAINGHLWDQKKRAYMDCIRPDGTPSPVFSQQTQTAAYIAGVAGGVRAARCRRIMQTPPRGFVTAGSPFFMFFLLEALVREGDIRGMVRTIRRYWGKQIDAGATTFWEMFHEDRRRMTRSHCHGWSAAPTCFLTKQILGVQPLEPGYAVIRIAPQTADLTWARGRVPTPHGVVACRWHREPRRFTFEATLPEKVAARIELPATGKVEVAEGSARKVRSKRGSVLMHCPGGKVTLVVGAAKSTKSTKSSKTTKRAKKKRFLRISPLMKRCRILYCSYDLGKPSGGVRTLWRHVAMLRRHGYEAFVLMWSPLCGQTWFNEDVPLLSFDRTFSARGDDIFVIPEEAHHILATLATSSGKKVVFCQNHFYIAAGLHGARDYSAYGVSEIFASSDVIAEFLIREGHCEVAPVVHYSIDHRLFRPMEKQMAIAFMPRKIPQVGRMIRQRFSERFPQSEPQWIEIDKQSESDTAQALARAAIFLSLSQNEGFGLPPIEAMACGCLVVGFHGQGGLEYARPDNGIWRPEGDADGCARALGRAIALLEHDPDAAKRFTENGRRTAARYTLERQERELLEYWRRLTAARCG